MAASLPANDASICGTRAVSMDKSAELVNIILYTYICLKETKKNAFKKFIF